MRNRPLIRGRTGGLGTHEWVIYSLIFLILGHFLYPGDLLLTSSVHLEAIMVIKRIYR